MLTAKSYKHSYSFKYKVFMYQQHYLLCTAACLVNAAERSHMLPNSVALFHATAMLQANRKWLLEKYLREMVSFLLQVTLLKEQVSSLFRRQTGQQLGSQRFLSYKTRAFYTVRFDEDSRMLVTNRRASLHLLTR